jgi:hypothetical protein
MIEKSATTREARFGSGFLDLDHTGIMIFLMTSRSRYSFSMRSAHGDEFRDQDTSGS